MSAKMSNIALYVGGINLGIGNLQSLTILILLCGNNYCVYIFSSSFEAFFSKKKFNVFISNTFSKPFLERTGVKRRTVFVAIKVVTFE